DCLKTGEGLNFVSHALFHEGIKKTCSYPEEIGEEITINGQNFECRLRRHDIKFDSFDETQEVYRPGWFSEEGTVTLDYESVVNEDVDNIGQIEDRDAIELTGMNIKEIELVTKLTWTPPEGDVDQEDLSADRFPKSLMIKLNGDEVAAAGFSSGSGDVHSAWVDFPGDDKYTENFAQNQLDMSRGSAKFDFDFKNGGPADLTVEQSTGPDSKNTMAGPRESEEVMNPIEKIESIKFGSGYPEDRSGQISVEELKLTIGN
ncbi:MAG: hypothetical protein V5A72_03035, partial [Candidatus Nanohaloarchaea archaeon]